MYWKTRNSHYDQTTVTTELGMLKLKCENISRNNQPYSITMRHPQTGKDVTVFSCDPHYGGLSAARKRCEHIALSYFHDIPIEYTEWEKKNATINTQPLNSLRFARTVTPVMGVMVKGIYHHKKHNSYLLVNRVYNHDTKAKDFHPELAGVPSVAFLDIFADVAYVKSVEDFLKLNLEYFIN